MKNLPIVASVLLAAVIIGGAVAFGGKPDGATQAAGNVSMEGGKQVIEINVKGGYAPKLTTAKAGVPTVLRLKTDGTYDCSSGVSVPALGFKKALEATGVTDVDVSPQLARGTIEGVCSMGMYSFSVQFM